MALAQTAVPEKTAAPAGAAGLWTGALNTGAFKLRLLVKISGQPGALTGTMDSLDQGVKDIPISTLTLHDDTLHFEIISIHGVFDGTRSADGSRFIGAWTQGGAALPLTLTRTDQAPRRRGALRSRSLPSPTRPKM